LNRNWSALCVVSALISVAAAQDKSASVVGSSTGAADTTPEVVVTGSLIRSTEKVQFNQVQVVTPQDIEATGSVTVADYLHDLAVNSASSWGDNFAYGATGGAGIAMRGLSEKYTLVLVDGQRVAPYGFPSNGTDTFVDLNTIPLNAIDRIEIVKTGAVSQYGSDAIGGVVNIITKKNFQGLEVSAGYGGATEGGESTKKLAVLGGFGDLDADRFNITATASYFRQAGYTLADRSNTASQDHTSQPNGMITRGANYWEPNGVGNGGAALNPCPYGGTVVNGGDILNGPGSGTACGIDTANGLSLHPDEERFNAKIHATFKLADELQAFVDLWDARNKTRTLQGYDGINDGTEAYNPANGGITQVSNIVPASNPYNPYGVPVPLTYVFTGQAQTLQTDSNFYRAAAGLEGTFNTGSFGQWSWSASFSHSQSTVDNAESGVESVAGLENVLNNGVFNFSNPGSTPGGLDGLYMNDRNEAISKLDTVDITASTTNLFALPYGNVGFGVGAQYLHESDYVTDYTEQEAGLAVPYYLQSINGQRNVGAVYYQLNIPLVPTLTFSQSGRYDHYSDFGGAFSPRFALSFKPISALTTYASYTRGFRAPTLAENSQSNSSGIQSAVDPNSPTNPTSALAYPVLIRGNPDLRPERTRNYNIGFEVQPDTRTSFGLDWYRIDVSNVIGTGNIQQIIDTNDPGVVVRNPNGTIAYVNMDYENLNTLMTEGFELNYREAIPAPLGTVLLGANWAYVWHFRQDAGGTTVDFAGNDGAIDTPFGASFPRWKGTTSAGWDYQSFTTTATYQFTGPYLLTQMPGRTPAYGQVNLTERYSGFRNLTLYATVNNLFNRQPPYDPLWLEFPTATPYDPSLYSDEGRYVEVGATYRF
jgi:iron complex outermembrane recepter protein